MLSTNKMSRIRRRLALRLSMVAIVGLLIFLALSFFLGVGFYFFMGEAWLGVIAGAPAPAGIFAVAGVMHGMALVYMIGIVWASWPMPRGIRLPRKAAPDLYNVMDVLADQMGVRPIKRVWISSDMNAILMQRPCYGSFGPIQTHLVIGLPLVHCLSAEQFTAVLAHEMAHLSEQRSGKDAYFVHLRAWWSKVLDSMHETFPWTERFLEKSVLRYYRDMIRLSRLEEFEADRKAAQIVGPELVGEALVEMSLKGRFLEQDYWPSVLAESLAFPDRSVRPYRQMGLGVAAGFLRRESVVEDLSHYEAGGGTLPFHPTLKERLTALGAGLEMPPDMDHSAAEHFFDELLPTISWALDQEWQAEANASREITQCNYLNAVNMDRLQPFEWTSLRPKTTHPSD